MIKVRVGGRAWRVGTRCRDHLGLVFTKFTSGGGLRPSLLEIPVADPLGIAHQAQYETVEQE